MRPENTSSKASSEENTYEVDIETMIERTKCSKPYYALEECLGEENRDWRRCQTFVKALNQCWVKENPDRFK